MGPKEIVLLLASVGVVFLGIYLFPTISSVVTDWVTNVMPGQNLTALEKFLIKILPYAGLGLFGLFAFWMFHKIKE